MSGARRRGTTWWTWTRDWAQADYERLVRLVALADEWVAGPLGKLVAQEVEESPRVLLASLLEDARALGRKRFFSLLDGLVPQPGQRIEMRRAAALWMAADPLYRRWAKRARGVLGPEAERDDGPLLSECGEVVPWDPENKGSREERERRQAKAIDEAYRAIAAGEATLDVVRTGVYWAATNARNEVVHGRTVSVVAGLVSARDLHRDVVALLCLGFSRHRRWLLGKGAPAPALVDVSCVDEGEERLRPNQETPGRSAPSGRRGWFMALLVVALAAGLVWGAWQLGGPGGRAATASGAMAQASTEPAPVTARAAGTPTFGTLDAATGAWHLVTVVTHAWDGARCAVGTRGYYDLEVKAVAEGTACTYRVWITKRGYLNSCQGGRDHPYRKQPRDGAEGQVVDVGGVPGLLARLDVGGNRGKGKGRRYLLVPCGADSLCGFWQTRGSEWARYGYSGFLLARRASQPTGQAVGEGARAIARAVDVKDAKGLAVPAVRCLARCARGTPPEDAEDAEAHWERCADRCKVTSR